MRSKFGLALGLTTLSLALLNHDGDDEDDDGKDDGQGDPDIVLGLVVVDGVVAVLLDLFHELLLFFLLRSKAAAFERSLYELSAALFTLLRVLELLALLGHRLLQIDQELLRRLADYLLVDLDVSGTIGNSLLQLVLRLLAERRLELLLALNQFLKANLSQFGIVHDLSLQVSDLVQHGTLHVSLLLHLGQQSALLHLDHFDFGG